MEMQIIEALLKSLHKRKLITIIEKEKIIKKLSI